MLLCVRLSASVFGMVSLTVLCNAWQEPGLLQKAFSLSWVGGAQGVTLNDKYRL